MKHLEILKIVGSAIGAILSLKFIFWLFSPSEIWTIVLIGILIMFVYGIHVVEWSEDTRISLFGLDIYHKRKVWQQYRIFGIIPITQKQCLVTKHSVLTDLGPIALPIAQTFISTVPFGALVSKVGKH